MRPHRALASAAATVAAALVMACPRAARADAASVFGFGARSAGLARAGVATLIAGAAS